MADEVQPNATGKVITNSASIKKTDVQTVLRTSPIGQVATAVGDNFRGINHQQAPSLIQINKEYYGLTFFTRPRLNLSEGNLKTLRELTPLLNTNSSSIQRIIRCYLDPVGNKRGDFTSPFVDADSPFISILSNQLVSMPGWPDLALPYSTSQEGVMKEQWNLVDGTCKILRSLDLTANFRNQVGDPITTMMMYWLQYMEAVYMGLVIPHPDAIWENEVDYHTRSYRVILDSTKRYVYRIGITGAAFPVSAPTGVPFNVETHHSGNGPVNSAASEQVSVHFAVSGISYNDDIIIHEFNTLGEMFNPGLKDITFSTTENGTPIANDKRSATYQKLSIDEIGLFNFRGYPRIDLYTYELEWFVRKDEYRQVLPLLTEFNKQRGK